MDQPNQRKVRTAEVRRSVLHSAQLEGLRNELRAAGNAFTAAAFSLRQTTENELRQIWGWINRPGIRNHLYAERVSFETFLADWHHWTADKDMHYVWLLKSGPTRLIIGFILLQCDADTVTVKIRPSFVRIIAARGVRH